ncbi:MULTISPECIES: serine/threonine-protein kinase [unclassified Microbacterium]|uniref:serine/threonine-protein kinase n=1 Tax=unclassified Microbacterium TaxID=2609290 RepID=UPI0021A800DC|nr:MULTISPECIES: serine/threonine-protein kinase [unclassified Microbacterium]MCT1365043.1 serine/threonine protein kinase [Microbacterium sp. p3-SID131]MCT1377060.1 serine/threonine protein kinase [Microbacterium sp. p3-SID337]
MKKRQVQVVDAIDYTLEAELGRGGAAEVWSARSAADDRSYALKRIAKDAKSGTRNQRFRNEIAYGLRANHPNVIKIHSQSEDDDAFYYVMDLYKATLQDVIEAQSDFEVLLDYAIQLCDALAYVHGEDVVHRDIKPQNILVDTAARRPVLADFGIARFKNWDLTRHGDLLANRNYLAPEQMARRDPDSVGKPADIFALGLIITELFTKQNPQGARSKRIADDYPFLSDIDLLTQRMTLQDETQRIGIEAARDSLLILRGQIRDETEDLAEEIRPSKSLRKRHRTEYPGLLSQAARDVLSARYILERSPVEDLNRYNPNYHCEISYMVTSELFNMCAQSRIYSIAKRVFDNESIGFEPMSKLHEISSVEKDRLQREFESLLSEYPLPRRSIWEGLPSRSAQLFRFCKAYHCEEIISEVQREVAEGGPLRFNLSDAPILWIAQNVRRYLSMSFVELDDFALREIEFERQVSVLWDSSLPVDSARVSTGSRLILPTTDSDEVEQLLATLAERWTVSTGERVDSKFSVHFRSRAEYERFKDEVLRIASPYHSFEGDVLDLVRPIAQHDDLVALVWDREYDIRSTLAKLLGRREISEHPRHAVKVFE